MKWTNIKAGVDAVFLPGKIHGCEWQVYIIYLNENANNGNGSFEIEICDAWRILSLYADVHGNEKAFFELLPDKFQGEWQYCNSGTDTFDEYVEMYSNADFIVDRDGGLVDEMLFLVNWAIKAVEKMR